MSEFYDLTDYIHPLTAIYSYIIVPCYNDADPPYYDVSNPPDNINIIVNINVVYMQ